jgi:hypothetical protein
MPFNSADALVGSLNRLKGLTEGGPAQNLGLEECDLMCQTAEVLGNSLFVEFLKGGSTRNTILTGITSKTEA